ncbi:hypothetical protein IQ243_27185 [Nostocales cyanobacterium LEGE 11386]|nr:hypothetical protein [Nostocales cyanobacterium LEGE 11386]
MKLLKKPELLTLKKAISAETTQEPLPKVDTVEYPQPIITSQTQATEVPKHDFSVQDYPIVPSAGNSGWQASDIWRDLRVDSFYDW